MKMIEFDPLQHTYTVDGMRYISVTQIIFGMGLYGDVANWFTEESRMRGKYVHQIIAWYLSDELDDYTVDNSLRGYLDAWKRFEVDTGFVPTITEKPLVNDLYLLAGTPDHIGMLNGIESVIDVKTGGVGPATGLQLAGYELLYGKPLKRLALSLRGSGKYTLIPFQDEGDRGIFLAAWALFNWKKNNLKNGSK